MRIIGQIKELSLTPASDDRSSDLAQHMPTFIAYEGRWCGEFQHYSNDGKLLESHHGFVKHEFPQNGPFDHIQHSHFTWDDGHEQILQQQSIFSNGRLWWESGSFQGCIWETEFGNVLVNISQTNSPRLCLNEIISPETNGNRRSRVRQWFKNGKLYKRTLCHERRINN
ncbi:MAG: hypothetical protein ABJO01_12555 [Parasphingorhabdus sp.]|uniref:hypothetical protein n=1 Tax=Parasphingorhabdus sp. TaxID=2709688 RepID=UPI00329748B8